MHRILAELHQDHVNLSRLLNVLERELYVFRRQGTPDYPLMLDVVDYVENYPDLIHHPREDIIFKVYLERGRKGEETLLRLMDEHQVLVRLSRDMRNLLEQLVQGSIIPRRMLEDAVADYLIRQRGHLDAEEGDVFALLNRALKAEDWERIAQSIPSAADPLFGEQVNQRYRAIFRQILAMS